jgi:hypothetical protein
MATFTVDAVITDGLQFARVSQAPLEVLVVPSDSFLRVSQMPLEVLVFPSDAFVRDGQATVEVLIKQPINGSTKADAVVKAHMSGSKTISAVLKRNVVHGTRDVTYAYSGPAIKIYDGHTKNAVETIIPGCDLTIAVPVGAPVTIIWDVWQSHFQWNVDKKEIVRLRRDGISGLSLWFTDPQSDGTDAGNNKTGHEWEFDGWYREAAHSGRYVLTVLPTKGNATLYSDSIYFSLQTPGLGGPGMTLDAAMVIQRTKSFKISARFKKSTGPITVVKAEEIDAVIRVPRSTSTSIDAMLFIWGLGAFVTRAAIFKPAISGSFTLGAQLTQHVESSFTLGALIRNPVTGSFTVDAAVRRETSSGRTLDAVVQRTSQPSLTTDAIITRGSSGSFGINAFLKLYSFRIDARIFVPATGSFTVAAAILADDHVTFTVAAVVARHDIQTLTLDAVIMRTSFGIPGAFE